MFKESFKEFLEINGFLPLTEWSGFELEHGNSVISTENYLRIKKEVGKKAGLYVYIKDDRTLYIGKASSLFGRIKSHCDESYKEVPGDTRIKTWHNFFSNAENVGRVRVLWKEVEKEPERQIIEKMLEYVIGSRFEVWRREFERSQKSNEAKT